MTPDVRTEQLLGNALGANALAFALDGLSQRRAGPASAPTSGELPEVVRLSATGSGKRGAAIGVGDESEKVHELNGSSLLPVCNSTLRLPSNSALLEHREMPKALGSIRDARRVNLAALLDKHGKANLGRLTEIDATYLWQMGKGQGKSARNVNDDNARAIETALGLSPGYMDIDHNVEPPSAPPTAGAQLSQPERLDHQRLAASIAFLERQFNAWDREFFANKHALLIAGVYDLMSQDQPPPPVELSRWLLQQVEEESHERRDEDSTIGGHDRQRATRRAG